VQCRQNNRNLAACRVVVLPDASLTNRYSFSFTLGHRLAVGYATRGPSRKSSSSGGRVRSVRFGSQTGAIEVRLAEFLRKLLCQTERDGESVRSSDRQNAKIPGLSSI
jgi:hypothetical protein